MNTIVKAARASPIQPANPALKPAGNKPISAAINFAELLGGELKKGKIQTPTPAPAEKEPPEREENSSTTGASSNDPLNLLNAAAGVTPPPAQQPAEPQRGGPGAAESEDKAQAGSPAAPLGESPTGAGSPAQTPGNAGATTSALQPGLSVAGAEVMNTQLAAAFKAAMLGAAVTAAPTAEQPQAPVTATNSEELAKKQTLASPALKDVPTGFQTRLETQPGNLAGARARFDDQAAAVPAPARQAEVKPTSGGTPSMPQNAAFADPLQSVRVQTSSANRVSTQAAIAEPAEAAPIQSQAQARPIDAGSLARALQANGNPGATPLAGSAAATLEPARTAEAQNNGMIWQVCQNVENMLKNRQSTLRVMLYPAEMGRIDLRLTTGSNGLAISLVAQQSSTNQLLEAQVSQLRQALDQAGIHLSNLSVGQQHTQAGSGQSNQQLPKQSSYRIAAAEEENGAEDRLTIASLEPSEGYDYRV